MKERNGQYQYEVENVHISTIQVGDTILDADGLLKTVCRNNISIYGFMGRSLFGDTYCLGTIPVKKVRFVLRAK